MYAQHPAQTAAAFYPTAASVKETAAFYPKAASIKEIHVGNRNYY